MEKWLDRNWLTSRAWESEWLLKVASWRNCWILCFCCCHMDGRGFIVTQIHKSIESKGGEEDNVTFHGWMATQKRVEHSRGKCPFMDEVVISLSTVRSPFFRPYLGYFNCCTQIGNRLLLLFATLKFLILRYLLLNRLYFALLSIRSLVLWKY